LDVDIQLANTGLDFNRAEKCPVDHARGRCGRWDDLSNHPSTRVCVPTGTDNEPIELPLRSGEVGRGRLDPSVVDVQIDFVAADGRPQLVLTERPTWTHLNAKLDFRRGVAHLQRKRATRKSHRANMC